MASYVGPQVRDKFESLSIDLKNQILRYDEQIVTIHDLIHVLEKVVEEGEGE